MSLWCDNSGVLAASQPDSVGWRNGIRIPEEVANVSLIATFHTLPSSQKSALIDAAKPQTKTIRKKVLFFTTTQEVTEYKFHDFLRSVAVEQESYEYGGNAFCELDFILEDRVKGLFDSGLAPVSKELSDIRESYIAAYDQDSAREVLEMLGRLALDADMVKEHLAKDQRPGDDLQLMVDAVLSAYEISKRWFATVRRDELGILEVG